MSEYLLRLQNSKVHAKLFEEDEGENSLRSESDESWHVALEESEWAELGSLLDDIEDAVKLARLCVHGASLQHIQRLG